VCLVVLKVEPGANSSVEDSCGELRNAATDVFDKVAFRDEPSGDKSFFFCAATNSFVERQPSSWFDPGAVDYLGELLDVGDSSNTTRILSRKRRNFLDYSQSL
jgi:hypothetical protein